MVDTPASSAARVQPCPRCGASLDVTGHAVGSWLACPGCGSPVAVRPRPVVRPERSQPALETVAWAPDPWLGPAKEASPPPLTLAPAPSEAPVPRVRTRRRRAGWAPFAILAIVAGGAQVMVTGVFLGPQGSYEMMGIWGSSFVMALFVSAMTRAILMSRETERSD